MRILITNIWLDTHGGTEVYVRDLATSLLKRGIQVEVYSPVTGIIATEMRQQGIPVVDQVDALTGIPDIIHAHHYEATMKVLMKFPSVPAVYFLHDRTHPADVPPKHPNIIKYIAVDYNCLDRIIVDHGIGKGHTGVIHNWVDTSRFLTRRQVNLKPEKALVFSNYANHENHFKLIQKACQSEGIVLDGVGLGFGNANRYPEKILGGYDIVFAKAKSAMEALSTGAGVIVCDYRGLGEMIDSNNFDLNRKYNFGMKMMTRSIHVDLIREEIARYNSLENLLIASRIRKEADLNKTIDKIVELYKDTIHSFQLGYRASPIESTDHKSES